MSPIVGYVGHSAEPPVMFLVVSKVHLENTAERNECFIRLKSSVFEHTESNASIF